jgi:hypothetical protein
MALRQRLDPRVSKLAKPTPIDLDALLTPAQFAVWIAQSECWV